MKLARALPLVLVATALSAASVARAGDAPVPPTPPAPPVPPAAPAPPPAHVETTPSREPDDIRVQIGGGHDDAVDVIGRLPPDVRAQLTGDQIENIIRADQDNHDRSGPTDMTEILVPGFFFATIIGIVVVLQLSRFRRERQLHETLRAMIEKGVEIPPALIVPDKPKPNDRRRGIVLVTLGAGLVAFLGVAEDDGSWAFGLVPLCLGLGYLLAWFLERRDPSSFDA